MGTDKPMPHWRNFAIWSAVGAIVCALAILAASAFRDAGIPATIFRSGAAITRTCIGLLVSAACVGLVMRTSPLTLRNFRNFAIWSAVPLIVSMLARGVFRAVGGTLGLGAMGVSETVAAVVGMILFLFAILGSVVAAIAHSRAHFMDAGQADETRELGRALIYSYIAMAAMGLTLIALSLAGPGGALPPAIALAGVLVLLGIVTVMTFAMRPLMDELQHTMSRDTGNAAFYLTIVIGGGWAILAHLGFVLAPAPLDWLTMLTLIMFAASFIAVGRRGLLGSR